MLLGNKNELHNNYQDFQTLPRQRRQDRPPARPAALRRVPAQPVPGPGRAGADARRASRARSRSSRRSWACRRSTPVGSEFKFGSIVSPGHRGIWQEPLRTGKYPVNPRCYAAEIVPTSILTLNWASAVSQAHNLDAHLSPIEGKSREGFVFRIDLQVQIHVPDTKAPKVISMVGTMQNLVNEVLQVGRGQPLPQHAAGVGGGPVHRDPSARCSEPRSRPSRSYLAAYEVETRGVYIQDVEFPPRSWSRC